MYTKRLVFVILALILALSLACSLGGQPPTEEPQPMPPVEEVASSIPEEPAQEEESASSSANLESDFPIPDDVDSNSIMELGNSAINFQTSLSMADAVSFYRTTFTELGYVEREINTTIEDATFSMVFDGPPSGKAIVIQGVNLGEAVNINIRFEDI